MNSCWFCNISSKINQCFMNMSPKNGPKTSGQPREAKHCWIFLKFGTLALWANTWGCFFHFFKILTFGPCGRVFGPKMDRKPSGQPREAKHCWMFLKFGTLVLLANTRGTFNIFFKNFDFWAPGTHFWPKNGPKNLRVSLERPKFVACS